MTWTCPLCGEQPDNPHMHGLTQHPATLPEHLTVADRLRLMPALAHELAATLGAPNPSPTTTARTSNVTRTPPLPIDAAAVDLLAPEDGQHPARPLTLIVECSRVVWESLDCEVRQQHPQPDGVPTWRTECAWLADVWPDAQAWLDLADVEWIDQTTRALTHQLATAARMGNPPRYRCPDCGWPMHLGEGDWLVCETGQHQHPGPIRLRDQWRNRAPMSTNMLAAELRITSHRIHVWHNRDQITPTHTEGRTSFWRPWDVIRCWRPDIAKDIDARFDD